MKIIRGCTLRVDRERSRFLLHDEHGELMADWYVGVDCSHPPDEVRLDGTVIREGVAYPVLVTPHIDLRTGHAEMAIALEHA